MSDLMNIDKKNCWNVIIGLVTAKEINSMWGAYFISAKTISMTLYAGVFGQLKIILTDY